MTIDDLIAQIKATIETGEAQVVQQLQDAISQLTPPGGVMTDAQKQVVTDVITALQDAVAKLQALIA